MEKLLNHIITSLCSEKGYGALFKAAAVFVGVALIALSQTGTFLYEKDLSAYKAKFTLEIAVKQPIEKIDCTKPGNFQLDCMIAKHELQILDDSLKLLDIVVRTSFLLGFLFAMLAVIGFGCSPYIASKVDANTQQPKEPL